MHRNTFHVTDVDDAGSESSQREQAQQHGPAEPDRAKASAGVSAIMIVTAVDADVHHGPSWWPANPAVA